MAKRLEEEQKYRLRIYALVFSFLLIIVSVVVISTYNANSKPKESIAIVTNSGNLTINYLDGNIIELKKAKKGDYTYTLSITNTGPTKNYYSIYLRNCVINKDDISVRLETEAGEKVYNEALIEGESLLRTIKGIEPGITERYKIIINNRNTANIYGEIEVVNESLNEQSFADLILNNNNITEAKTNIGVDLSISNEGLISSIDNDGPTYYFRGNVNENYLQINENMYRIIRINGDESVRVILDEKIELKAAYNLNENEDRKQLSLYLNSTLNETLKKWYEENLSQYDDFIAESTFCSDPEFIIDSEGGKKSNTYQRIFVNNKPSLKCNSASQKSKIGVISIDEIVFAGASTSEPNKTYYLYNPEINYSTWTTGSYELKEDGTLTMTVLNQNGGLTTGENISTTLGVRPVINISNKAHIRGQGTKENPYILVK